MKTILLLVTVLTSTFGAQAQGLIFFGNNNATKISTNSFIGGSATAATANVYYYALFYSTTATTVEGTTSAQMPGVNSINYGLGAYAFYDPNWTFAAYGTNSPSLEGRFFSSVQNADGSTTVNGVAGGSSAQFVVVGWSASLGSTLTDLEYRLATFGYGWIGESAVSGTITLGNGNFPPAPPLFGSSSPFIQGFTLGMTPVPEPASLALAAAGAAGLFFCRRQRNS